MTDAEEPAAIEHPMLAEDALERRLYQLQLAGAATEGHTLVCLPTGLGKTAVSLLVTARRLHEVGGKSLLLAPTKPLVEQHAEFYREALEVPDDEIVVFTGEVRPDDRAALWEDARVVIATPQVVENDLIGNRISLAEVTHCTFDECHRATGDYAYVYIAERYHEDADDPLVTGMSASPGGDEEEILTVCANLGLRQVEVTTEEDADVDEFTHGTEVEWATVELPEAFREIRDALTDVIEERLGRLRELGVTQRSSADMSQRDLNELRGKLQELIDADESAGYEGMSIHAEIMKLRRALELVETQSIEALDRYFERAREGARSSGASKASQRFVSDPTIQETMRRVERIDERHPKFKEARVRIAETLGIDDGERVIVFTESRDTAEVLTEFLGEHFETRRFVGQGDKEGSDGMTQTEQQAALDAFRDGDFSVLVSTSVAEEGLDVPEVDLVLFYEPVPTAIRSIQRKGRTGRQAEGKVVVLMAEDTRDEAYFWIAQRREDEMEEELRELKAISDELDARLAQSDLESFAHGDPAAADATADAGSGDGAEATGDAATGDGATGGETTGDEPTGDAASTDDGAGAGQSDVDAAAQTPASGGASASAADGAGSNGASEAASGQAASDGGDARSKSGDGAVADGDGQAGLESFVGEDDGADATDDRATESHDPAETEGSNEAGSDESGASAGDAGDSVDAADGQRDATADAESADANAVVAEPAADEVEVVIDQRELESSIARDLSRRDGVETRLETLAVGDYVCSDRVAVERKTVEDFLDTLLGGDRSLFEQAGDLVRHYPRSVVVLEGEGLYERRDVHPNAIRGALTSLAVDFGLSVLHSDGPDETVELLATIAEREQGERDREVSTHGEKQSKTLDEQQEYVVASIAEIGPVTARSLLAHFGSVEAVMTASEDDLLEVEGVGQVTADRIREVVGSEWAG